MTALSPVGRGLEKHPKQERFSAQFDSVFEHRFRKKEVMRTERQRNHQIRLGFSTWGLSPGMCLFRNLGPPPRVDVDVQHRCAVRPQ